MPNCFSTLLYNTARYSTKLVVSSTNSDYSEETPWSTCREGNWSRPTDHNPTCSLPGAQRGSVTVKRLITIDLLILFLELHLSVRAPGPGEHPRTYFVTEIEQDGVHA